MGDWKDNHAELTERLTRNIYNAGGLKFGNFKLKSGLESPYYLDGRNLPSSRGIGQPLVKDITKALYLTASNEVGLDNFDMAIGIPDAIVPYVGCLTYEYGIPSGYTIKVLKDHGIAKFVQADIRDGDVLLTMDDLITSGKSVIENLDGRIAKQCEQDNIHAMVNDSVFLIDRLQGGADNLISHVTEYSPNGIKSHAFMTILDMIESLNGEGLLSDSKYKEVKNYVETSPPIRLC